MKKPIIYLAGLISTAFPESLRWRQRVMPELEAMGFEVRSPLRGKRDISSKTTDGGINYSAVSSKSIILRDRVDVRESSVILAHLELFDSPRPLLGSIAEFAWAWDQRTPVVGIACKDNFLMRNHPFMVEFISHIEEDEQAALAFIRKYYAPQR